jgi:hypothetical protein
MIARLAARFCTALDVSMIFIRYASQSRATS